MLARDPYQTYQKVQIETANPLGLVIKLYDGAIKFLHLAQQGIAEKDYETANKYIIKAQKIINELNVTLDMDAGEVAANLRRLYDFLYRSLTEVNVKKDGELLQWVINNLLELRSAWSSLMFSKDKAVSE